MILPELPESDFLGAGARAFANRIATGEGLHGAHRALAAKVWRVKAKLPFGIEDRATTLTTVMMMVVMMTMGVMTMMMTMMMLTMTMTMMMLMMMMMMKMMCDSDHSYADDDVISFSSLVPLLLSSPSFLHPCGAQECKTPCQHPLKLCRGCVFLAGAFPSRHSAMFWSRAGHPRHTAWIVTWRPIGWGRCKGVFA